MIMLVYIFVIDYTFVILKCSAPIALAPFVILISSGLDGVACIIMVPKKWNNRVAASFLVTKGNEVKKDVFTNRVVLGHFD